MVERIRAIPMAVPGRCRTADDAGGRWWTWPGAAPNLFARSAVEPGEPSL